MLSLDAHTRGVERAPLVLYLPGFDANALRETPASGLARVRRASRPRSSAVVRDAAAGRIAPRAHRRVRRSRARVGQAAQAWLGASAGPRGARREAFTTGFRSTVLLDELLLARGIRCDGRQPCDRSTCPSRPSTTWTRSRRTCSIGWGSTRRFAPAWRPSSRDSGRAGTTGRRSPTSCSRGCCSVEYVVRSRSSTCRTARATHPRRARARCARCTTRWRSRPSRSAEHLRKQPRAALRGDRRPGRAPPARPSSSRCAPRTSGGSTRFASRTSACSTPRFGADGQALGQRRRRERATGSIEGRLDLAALDEISCIGGSGSSCSPRRSSARPSSASESPRARASRAQEKRWRIWSPGTRRAASKWTCAHRRFEQEKAANLDPRFANFAALQEVVRLLREQYRAWVDAHARRVDRVLRAAGLSGAERVCSSARSTSRSCSRSSSEGERVAVFLVDALRYEMARDLSEMLQREAGTTVALRARVAELPTITAVGMNCVVPVARRAIGSRWPGSSRAFARESSRSRAPSDRAEAIGRAASQVEESAPARPLADLSDIPDKLANQVQPNTLVVVQTREIDDAGEANVGVRLSFDGRCKTCCPRRGTCSKPRACRRFVFVADHGFLLQDECTTSSPFGTKTDPRPRYVLDPHPRGSRRQPRVGQPSRARVRRGRDRRNVSALSQGHRGVRDGQRGGGLRARRQLAARADHPGAVSTCARRAKSRGKSGAAVRDRRRGDGRRARRASRAVVRVERGRPDATDSARSSPDRPWRSVCARAARRQRHRLDPSTSRAARTRTGGARRPDARALTEQRAGPEVFFTIESATRRVPRRSRSRSPTRCTKAARELMRGAWFERVARGPRQAATSDVTRWPRRSGRPRRSTPPAERATTRRRGVAARSSGAVKKAPPPGSADEARRRAGLARRDPRRERPQGARPRPSLRNGHRGRGHRAAGQRARPCAASALQLDEWIEASSSPFASASTRPADGKRYTKEGDR